MAQIIKTIRMSEINRPNDLVDLFSADAITSVWIEKLTRHLAIRNEQRVHSLCRRRRVSGRCSPRLWKIRLQELELAHSAGLTVDEETSDDFAFGELKKFIDKAKNIVSSEADEGNNYLIIVTQSI